MSRTSVCFREGNCEGNCEGDVLEEDREVHQRTEIQC
jgi:hypothetical protein